MLIDRLRHLALQNGGHRLPAETPVGLAPLQSLSLNACTNSNLGKFRIVTAFDAVLEVLPLADLSNPQSTPFHRSNTKLRISP